jgi:hypothetical protein
VRFVLFLVCTIQSFKQVGDKEPMVVDQMRLIVGHLSLQGFGETLKEEKHTHPTNYGNTL